MIRRLRTRLAVALAATGGLALLATTTAGPASASTNCPYGNHCVFFYGFGSASHQYYDGDQNFGNDYFNVKGDGHGYMTVVDNHVGSASNSSSQNRESHYYLNINPSLSSALAFCVNPGEDASYAEVAAAGKVDVASALIIRNRTSVHCL